MIVNFLFQVLLLFLCIVLAHASWTYIQNNLLKKPVDVVSSTQIEKYEKIIEELQQSQTLQEPPQPLQTPQQSPLDPSITDSSIASNIIVDSHLEIEQELDQFVDTLL